MNPPDITELNDEYLTDIRIIANAIGYEVFKDSTEVTTNESGISQIWIEEEDTKTAIRAATRVLREMVTLGWSKVDYSSGKCSSGKCRCG